MPKPTWLLTAMLMGLPTLGQATPTDDFNSRVGLADLIFTTPEGQAYTQSLSPQVQKAMQTCIPAGSTPAAALGKFVFIANVTKAGLVTAGEVRPQSPLAQCFALQLTENSLPPPPLPAGAKIGYPIVIEMKVTP